MPRADQANVHNAPGLWYVDTRCARCDAARHWAPGLIEMDDAGRSFVSRQSAGEEPEAALWRAAGACPNCSAHMANRVDQRGRVCSDSIRYGPVKAYTHPSDKVANMMPASGQGSMELRLCSR